MKKLLIGFIALILLTILAPAIANAQRSSTPSPYPTTQQENRSPRPIYPLNTDSDVPQNFHTYSQNVFIELLVNVSCVLTGYDPLSPNNQCLGINPVTKKIGYIDNQSGAIGFVGNMIGMTFMIPVSSTTYMADIASNFGIISSSFADHEDDCAPLQGDTIAYQTCIDEGILSGAHDPGSTSLGFGYNGLKPVLNMWKMFRNIVYLILVLLFIIIGLGIMLRVNIDARSVMTIQNQLPKIVIGIILVTLSYAIAGFIVDLMYVFMYLIYYMFTQQALGMDVAGLSPSNLQGTSPLGAIGGLGGASSIAFDAARPLGNIFASLFDNTFGRMIAGLIGGIIGAGAGSIVPGVGTIIGGIVGGVVGTFAGSQLLGMVGGLIAYIIITIAVVWAMLRLWFLLLRSYIFFLVDVIIAPFWIGLGLLPKSSNGFETWLRDIIANLAVFPATLFILLVGKILVSQFSSASARTSFVPPLIGNPGDPSSFGSIIGLGVILMLPGVVSMVRDTLKAPGFKYSQQIAQSIGQGQKIAGLSAGKLRESVWRNNPRTGAPERLKAWYLDRIRSNFGGKGRDSQIVSAPGKLKDSIMRRVPGKIGKNATQRQREIAHARSIDEHIQTTRQSGSFTPHSSQNRIGAGTDEGRVNGKRAVIRNGMVRIYENDNPDSPYEEKSVEEVPFDRMGFEDQAQNPTAPTTPQPAESTGPRQPTGDQLREVIDRILANRPVPRTYNDLSDTERTDVQEEALEEWRRNNP